MLTGTRLGHDIATILLFPTLTPENKRTDTFFCSQLLRPYSLSLNATHNFRVASDSAEGIKRNLQVKVLPHLLSLCTLHHVQDMPGS